MRYVFISFFLLLLSACMKSIKVDLIVHNASIYTMDMEENQYEAMAIKDGKIVELGPERQILNKYRADAYHDAHKKIIYPGFIDAHCHFLGLGQTLLQVDLKSARSYPEMLADLAEYGKKHTETWVVGRGWDHTIWPNSELPHKNQLDSLFPNRPVLLTRVDGHAAIANSVALQISGFNENTRVPGGHLDADENGLTGIVYDKAIHRIRDSIPLLSESTLINALLLAQQKCFEAGLTTVDDAGLTKRDLDIIERLHSESRLKMRIYAMLSDNHENFEHFLKTGPIKTERLHINSFKFYGDGSLGSRTACLLIPYSDMPENNHYGIMMYHPDTLKKYARQVYKAGFQLNTHCIGDSAVRLVAKVYGEILRGVNDRRWRIEHAQVIHQRDFELFKQYTILPSVQPTHATSDYRWAQMRLGAMRLKQGYAYKTLLNQNGIIALGTDFPVEDYSPIGTFYAAVFRKDRNGNPQGGFLPENALSRKEALLGMTFWAALANFEEHEKLADFIILDKDLMTVPESEILKTRIINTFVNGEKVYGN
jgi:predicted amidohydrolase YtcJ